MDGFRKGDRVWFTSVPRLVNEGTVESVEGPFLRVMTKACGTSYLPASQAFCTREELKASRAYNAAWYARHERDKMRASFTRMASLPIYR